MSKMRSLSPGDAVRISSTRTEARVIEGPNKKDEYLLLAGAVRIWAHSSQLSPPKAKKKTKHPRSPSSRSAEACPSTDRLSIDLHGFTVEQAIIALETAIDRALLRHCSELIVIHGLGSGKVKNAVHNYLAASKHISSYQLENANPGTTRVFL